MARTKAPTRVADLKPADYNPRKMTPEEHEALAASMDLFGDLSGVVFNRRTGNLVGAHQRREHMPTDAAIAIHGTRSRKPDRQGTVAVGWIEFDGIRWAYREVDVDEPTEKAMNLAANRWGEAAWDYAKLPTVMQATGWDPEKLAATGFRADQIEVLLGVEFDPGQATDPGGAARSDNEGGGWRLDLTPDQWAPLRDLAEKTGQEPGELVADLAVRQLAALQALELGDAADAD